MAIVAANPTNTPQQKGVRNRSKFNLSYPLFGTYRFGQYQPHFVMECVPQDGIKVRCAHDIQSYTLKSPLLSDVKVKKDYFMVPMQCILPLNWEKIYRNPSKGDDINNSLYGTSYPNFMTDVKTFLDRLWTNLVAGTSYAVDGINHFRYQLEWLLIAEMFYSHGSLMSSLGYHFGDLFEGNLVVFDSVGNKRKQYFDEYFDKFISDFVTQIESPSTNYIVLTNQAGDQYYVGDYSGSDYQNVISVRGLLDLLRDGQEFGWSWVSTGGDDPDVLPELTKPTLIAHDAPIDLASLFAYQICCSHFYTNDKIDYVYSAELYREQVYSAYYKLVTNWAGESVENPKFIYNGIRYRYDNLCTYFIQYILTIAQSAYLSNKYYFGSFNYLRLIFQFRNSLRFVDYFTGSKSQPLAVGDVNVTVNANKVNIVDTVVKNWAARFFNFVNRAPQKMSGYVRELFGADPEYDYHDPMFLAHTNDEINTSQTENTADGQRDPNPITSRFGSNASRYAFEFGADYPCIVIGIMYFDIPRVYRNNLRRQLFHEDRFDMFNPFMQFTGDQVVHLDELRSNGAHSNNFGYQMRYQEYKERVGEAFGGFANGALPSYCFLADTDATDIQQTNIGPSYIRSRPSEFDPFYTSLTGYSLGTYFHFFGKNVNYVSASRPMAFAPTLL